MAVGVNIIAVAGYSRSRASRVTGAAPVHQACSTEWRGRLRKWTQVGEMQRYRVGATTESTKNERLARSGPLTPGSRAAGQCGNK